MYLINFSIELLILPLPFARYEVAVGFKCLTLEFSYEAVSVLKNTSPTTGFLP
jgi:hypothetical protein